MPRKAVLSAVQQAALTALPTAEHDLRLHYTLSEKNVTPHVLRHYLPFPIMSCTGTPG